MLPDLPLNRDVDGRLAFDFTFSQIRKPVAMLVQELLVHRPSFPDARRELMVSQYQEGDFSMEAARKAMQYPIDERLIREGRADEVPLPEVPRYAELLRYGTDAVEWDLSEFDVYRIKVPYPIMYSSTKIYFYLDRSSPRLAPSPPTGGFLPRRHEE